ncbi:hypothetical protein EDB85DRAFT_1899098 [Lactarius pseudohatsudake]|nr:hypothetical protein EDB85DRAFT_1899098 [Lactarius pseudohatsudake]
MPLRKDEEFRMNIPLPSDPQGRVWSWGNRAPPPRDTTGPSYSCRILLNCNKTAKEDREYRAQAASLRAEANRIRQLYSELRRVYGGESELTDTVEEMVVELELDKYQVQAGSHRRHRRNIITSPTLPQCYNTDTAPQGHDTDMTPPGYNINTALRCGSDTDTVPRGYDGAAVRPCRNEQPGVKAWLLELRAQATKLRLSPPATHTETRSPMVSQTMLMLLVAPDRGKVAPDRPAKNRPAKNKNGKQSKIAEGLGVKAARKCGEVGKGNGVGRWPPGLGMCRVRFPKAARECCTTRGNYSIIKIGPQ